MAHTTYTHNGTIWTRDELISLHHDYVAEARRLRSLGTDTYLRDNVRASLVAAASIRHTLTH